MAYEEMTYEAILDDMISTVTEKYPELDTREGSIIFNALAPAALELAIVYSELDNVLNETFVGTASREYIYLACEQIGMDTSMFDAHAGTFKGEFDVEVPIGSRWNCDLYNYVVTELIQKNTASGYYEYSMTCETAGEAPNIITGSLTAITDLPDNLTHAELTACLVEGEDEYTDEAIKESYFDYINATASDGNIGQYERWCSQYDGIGNFKVLPLWNGSNTVKVSILSSSNRAASTALVNNFQKYLDPGITGMGNGVAPIGAFVTVSTATEVPVNVTCTVTLKSGYTNIPDINASLTDYFSSIAYEKSQVSYMSVGAVILSVEGVDAISNLKINNGTADISLQTEQIPVLGTTTWTEGS